MHLNDDFVLLRSRIIGEATSSRLCLAYIFDGSPRARENSDETHVSIAIRNVRK